MQGLNKNLLNDEYRRRFIQKCDSMTLNQYLKNMERLSKKNAKFKAIYDSDIKYILSMTKPMSGGGILSLLFGTKVAPGQEAIMSERSVCDTEGYVNRINNLTKDTFCAITTQQTAQCDNRCDTRLGELGTIKKILLADLGCKIQSNDWIRAVRKFIDIVLCCGNTFAKPENEPLRTIYFKELSKLVTSNPKFLKEAFSYSSRILRNESGKLNDAFMREYAEMRATKKTKSKSEYSKIKAALIAKYINKLNPNGFEIVYSSKLIEKIINAYKKANGGNNK